MDTASFLHLRSREFLGLSIPQESWVKFIEVEAHVSISKNYNAMLHNSITQKGFYACTRIANE